METTYADSWSEMSQPCDMDLWVMKWRSAWPIFHSPLILPYVLKTVWCMYIILREYESVWPDVWPQNKCRSLWPIFHDPVILPYILKTIWCMNIHNWDYESIWPDIWPQNKYRSLWPIFHGPVILHYILKTVWCMNIILWDYRSYDLKINVCHCYIYFMVQWFCHVSKAIWWMSVIFSGNETVWPKLWPQSKYRSTWPLFHGLGILLNIFKIIWWMNIIVGIMDHCDTKIDLIKYM